MLRIKVKYFGKIRSVTQLLEEELTFNGNTVRDLLDFLADRYGPKFKEMIIKNDKLADDIIILVNRKSIGNRLETALKDGDTVSILPFVSGG